jgi:hypothetical protein
MDAAGPALDIPADAIVPVAVPPGREPYNIDALWPAWPWRSAKRSSCSSIGCASDAITWTCASLRLSSEMLAASSSGTCGGVRALAGSTNGTALVDELMPGYD